MAVHMLRDEFEQRVADALDGIPEELARLMRNVVVLVEDEPTPEAVLEHAEGGDLLGLYEGTPLTERGEWYAGVLPDRITIFRRPVLRQCRTPDQVTDQVRVTVAHEIAHHFGISDERLHELGYG